MYFKEQFMEINRDNYETFFLLYLDRELNPSEVSEVERLVNENADLQKELSLLRHSCFPSALGRSPQAHRAAAGRALPTSLQASL